MELFLYPSLKSTPYDVRFSDGTEIAMEQANKLLSITRQHEVKWDCQDGDMLLVDNLQAWHGRTPYPKQAERTLYVAVGGSFNSKKKEKQNEL